MSQNRCHQGFSSPSILLGIAFLTWTIPALADDLPVVFVPGLGGTTLVLEQKRPDGTNPPIWVAPSLMRKDAIRRLRLNPDGTDPPGGRIIPGGPLLSLNLVATLELQIADPDFNEHDEDRFRTNNLFILKPFTIPVYGDFKDWAVANWGEKGFSIVSYDWRKGAGPDSDLAIDRAIDAALKATGKSKVILIAHSLGGLAARHYLHDPKHADRVQGLITAGTAWLGAPKPARALRYGYSFGLGGRVGLSDEQMIKGIYIYYREKEGDPLREEPARSLSLVSLVNLKQSAELAATLPCVFQLLPTDEYMRKYGRSVFLGETPEKTLEGWDRNHAEMMKEARERRAFALDGANHGVRQTIIAGTLDPSIAPEYAMDLQMADLEHPCITWFSFDLKELVEIFNSDGGGKKLSLWEMARKGFTIVNATFFKPRPGAWNRFVILLVQSGRPNREVLTAFFEINPALRDLGNFNWSVVRSETLRRAHDDQDLPIYADPYVAIHTDAPNIINLDADTPELRAALRKAERWGDGATPLLSATFGHKHKIGAGKYLSTTLQDSPIGKSVDLRIVPLDRDDDGEFIEHSRMLDDVGVRMTILKAYRKACLRGSGTD